MPNRQLKEALAQAVLELEMQNNLQGLATGLSRAARPALLQLSSGLPNRPVESLQELPHLAARYRPFYNTLRPHPALGYKTPLEGIEEAKTVVSFL